MSRALGGIVCLFYFLISGWVPCAAQETTGESKSAAPVMEVRYVYRGIQDARDAYRYQLIHELLEVTRAEYGDYKVIPFGGESSTKRQSLLISEGRVLNLTWASPGTVIANADVISIPVDILKGLLGYRICLINPANFPSTIHKLSDMVIGQGLNWSDVEIYRFNDIPVREAPSFEALFDQYHAADLKFLALHQRRYFCMVTPYLPLSGQCTETPVLLQHQP